MRTIGPCCTFEVFWEAFMWRWRDIHNTDDAETPDFIVARARHYWKVYAMTGFEAAQTCYRKLEAGKL